MQAKLILLSLFSSSILLASNFTGVGYGDTLKKSKYEALADLSMNIKAEVSTQVQNSITVEQGAVKRTAKQNVSVTSKLPIIGAEYTITNVPGSQKKAEVYLSQEKASKLYRDKLQNLNSEIKTLEKQLQNSDDSSEKEHIYKALLLHLNSFDRYRSVAIVVGVEDISMPLINRAEIEGALFKLHQNITSMALATTLLSEPFLKYNKIFVYPPMYQNSHEITPFAKVVKMALGSKLKTVRNLSDAEYLLVGEYIENENGLFLSYTLVSKSTQEDIASSLVILQPKAYDGFSVKPKTLSFDQLLHSGVALSSSFKVAVSTNQGSEALLFNEGENLELMVKLNKMGYFYVVGYTELANKRFSYLLELRDAPGNGKFQFFVNADDANKWISLGAFDVAAPFGVESLQVIGATQKMDSLPSHHYDDESGYFLIGSKPEESVVKTRGLKRKKRLGVEKAEGVLMFTTMPK